MVRKTGLALFLGFAVALLGGPAVTAAQDGATFGGLQVVKSVIGDVDCFGYGLPLTMPASLRSPCGTLAGPPIVDDSDPVNTDVTVDCTAGNTFTFTHTLDLPLGSTVLGGVAVVNVGGVQRSIFPTVITADGVPGIVPDTGEFGTGLVVIPLTSSSLLTDGQVVITVTHGSRLLGCDPVFVDFSAVAVLVALP